MKQTIITILFTLVAMAGHGQIHYSLEGTIGDSTLNTRLLLNQGMSAMKLVNAAIDTLEVVGGKLIPTEGTLEEPVLKCQTLCKCGKNVLKWYGY